MSHITTMGAALLLAAAGHALAGHPHTLPSGASAAGTSSATNATVQGQGATTTGTLGASGGTIIDRGAAPAMTQDVPRQPVGDAPSTRIEMGGPPSASSPSGARGSIVPGPFEPSLIGDRADCPPDMRKREGVCIPAPAQ